MPPRDFKRDSEAYIEKAVNGYAQGLGWLTRKWTSPNNRGVPDRIYFKKGYPPVAVEYKRWGKKPTKLQSYEHATLEAYGVVVAVVDRAQTGREFFDKLELLYGQEEV